MLVNERCVLGARRRHGSPYQPGDGRAPYGRAKRFWQWAEKEKRPAARPAQPPKARRRC